MTVFGAQDDFPVPPPAWVGFTVTGLAAALVLLGLLEWGVYADQLGLDQIDASAWDRLLIAWAIVAKTLLVLLSCWAIATVVSWWRPGVGRSLWLVGGAMAMAYLALDLRLYQLTYRHLDGFFQFAGEKAARDFMGSSWVWIGPLLVTGIVTVVLWLLLVWAGSSLLEYLRRRGTWLDSRPGRAALLIATVVGVLGPAILPGMADQPLLLRRLIASLPLDPAFCRGVFERPVYAQPRLDSLHEELESAWARHAPTLLTVEPVDSSHAPLRRENQPQPHILLLVVESLQYDVLAKGWMPRLAEWSVRGMQLDRHFSGGQLTEEGMFSLCYGRSPLLYNQTLDAGVPPQLVQSLGREGYATTFLSAHQKEWLRMDSFLSEPPFDHAIYFDSSDWPTNDRAVVREIDRILVEADRPQLIVAFFMSTHFEYRFPPEYARHQPTEGSPSWVGRGAFIDPVPMRNCYRNALLFTDDLLADLLTRHAERPMITVLTSDQGESMGEDGGIGHGQRTSDIRLRVPMVLRGPGVPAQVLQEPTQHADLLPTLFGLLAGRPVTIRGATGVDLLHPPGCRAGVVVEMCSANDTWLLMARGEDRLRVRVSLTNPRLVIDGFEDGKGRLLASPPESAATPEVWVQLLEDHLGKRTVEPRAVLDVPPSPR